MKKTVVACVLTAALALSSSVSAAQSAFLVLQGAKGRVTGSVVQKGREGSIEVIGSEHQVASANAGSRTHSAFVVKKKVDIASPKLYSALIGGETFDATVSFVRAGANGVDAQYYTVKLTKARITDIKFSQANGMETEEVAFTYQEITWTFVDGNTTVTDTKKN
jgi:type VI secretion system Hcp family effector